MGMAAAYKARRVLQNAQQVIATEFLCAAQGLEFLHPLKPGTGVAELYHRIRGATPPVLPLTQDRPPAPDLAQLSAMIAMGGLDPDQSPAGNG